jgi:hypothetical protein
LPAYTNLFLAHPNGRADGLKGMYIDSCHDLGEILKKMDVVKERNLYSLRVGMFTTEFDLEMRKVLKQGNQEKS